MVTDTIYTGREIEKGARRRTDGMNCARNYNSSPGRTIYFATLVVPP